MLLLSMTGRKMNNNSPPQTLNGFSVRPASLADAEMIAEIEAVAFEPMLDRLWGAEAVKAHLGAGKGLIGVCEGEVAAYALWRVAADEAELLKIATSPKWRRRGFCAILLNMVLKEGRTLGAASFFLEVREMNAPARALYKKAGFVDVGLRRNYYESGHDAAVMQLDLC